MGDPVPGVLAGRSGLARRLRDERAQQRPQGLASALGARDPPLVVLANGQGERHFALALVTVVLVHRHGSSSLRFCARFRRPRLQGVGSRAWMIPRLRVLDHSAPAGYSRATFPWSSRTIRSPRKE